MKNASGSSEAFRLFEPPSSEIIERVAGCRFQGSERVNRRTRSVLAGVTAAMLWGFQEPLDKRLFRCDYSDIAVLGKAVTRGAAWPVAGLAIHAVNGAIFGLVFYEMKRRVSLNPRRLAIGMALTEHVALFPLTYFVDRFHPARNESGVPRLLTNPRAFGQATWRHTLFGLALGRLA
jgi:hypothetical protein